MHRQLVNLLSDVPSCINRIAKNCKSEYMYFDKYDVLRNVKKEKKKLRRGRPIIAADSFKPRKNQHKINN